MTSGSRKLAHRFVICSIPLLLFSGCGKIPLDENIRPVHTVLELHYNKAMGISQGMVTGTAESSFLEWQARDRKHKRGGRGEE